jgi:P-type E1-E2 ATPase
VRHLVLDVNGTLTGRGELLDGVRERLQALHDVLDVRLVSADTYGTVRALATELRLRAHVVTTGQEKLALVNELGAERCLVIGNGANDVDAMRVSALAIAVIGPEGAAAGALWAADVVCRSITEALDLVLDPTALSATLRL